MKQPQSFKRATLLDRDHSILGFNERVLDWAYREDVPLLATHFLYIEGRLGGSHQPHQVAMTLQPQASRIPSAQPA